MENGSKIAYKNSISEMKKNKTSSKQQNGNDFTDDVWRSSFNREKKKLPKGKYKYVYSYELPTGEIVH